MNLVETKIQNSFIDDLINKESNTLKSENQNEGNDEKNINFIDLNKPIDVSNIPGINFGIRPEEFNNPNKKEIKMDLRRIDQNTKDLIKSNLSKNKPYKPPQESIFLDFGINLKNLSHNIIYPYFSDYKKQYDNDPLKFRKDLLDINSCLKFPMPGNYVPNEEIAGPYAEILSPKNNAENKEDKSKPNDINPRFPSCSSPKSF